MWSALILPALVALARETGRLLALPLFGFSSSHLFAPNLQQSHYSIWEILLKLFQMPVLVRVQYDTEAPTPPFLGMLGPAHLPAPTTSKSPIESLTAPIIQHRAPTLRASSLFSHFPSATHSCPALCQSRSTPSTRYQLRLRQIPPSPIRTHHRSPP